MAWQNLTIGDVVSLQRGYDLPERDRMPGSIPVYGSFGITGYHDVARAEGPGVTVGRSGASFGVVNYSPTDYWPHNTALFVTDFKGNHPRFVFYLLKTVDFASLNSGSAQPSLNRNFVYPVPARVPTLTVQRQIAAILSSFDDLIENNRRRIALLEQMILAIHREWFVHFRYPGHESDMLVDSARGPVPRGWRVATLAEDLPFAFTKPSVTRYEGARPYVATADCSGVHEIAETNPLTFDELPTRAQHEPIRSSVWFGRMAGYQKIMLFPSSSEPPKYTLSSGFACLRADPGWFSYIASCVMDASFEDEKDRYATGATQVSLTDAGAKSMIWLVPETRVAALFDEIVSPQLELLVTLRRLSLSLASVRDLLLPKLVTGAIDISTLDLGPELETVA